MKPVFAFLLLIGLHNICVAEPPDAFPAAAVAFVDAELAQMEPAVRAEDRTFFAASKIRMEEFLSKWALGSRQLSALDRFPTCTDAVTDYLIVGVCRISPPNTICEPQTFIPKFENNLSKCRDAAKAKTTIDTDPQADWSS